MPSFFPEIGSEQEIFIMTIKLLRYHEIVKACALEEDIQNMQAGDMSEIAEQGSNLSGGQKARITLARYHSNYCQRFAQFIM